MKANVIANFELEKEDVKAIKKYCIDEDITMEKLAARLGISRQFLNDVVNGKGKVSLKLYRKMAKLGIFEISKGITLIMKELKN